MIRRLDVPGGMAKRTMSGPRYAKRVFTFLHNVLGHYFPMRFALLYPAYIYMCAYHVTQWICSDSIKHRTLTPARVGGERLVFVAVAAVGDLARELGRQARRRRRAFASADAASRIGRVLELVADRAIA